MLAVSRPSAPLLRGRAPSRSRDVGLSCSPQDKQQTDAGFAHSLVNWVFSPAPSPGENTPDFVPPLAAEAARRSPKAESSAGLTRLTRPDALQLTLAAAAGLAAPPGHDGTHSPESELPLSSRGVSPRRSRVLAFTCNVCGQRSRRHVNPGVLETGTLFVQCSNADCMVFHKVVDNLALFSELSGPVFHPPPIRDARARVNTPLVGLGGWAAAVGLDVDALLNLDDNDGPR